MAFDWFTFTAQLINFVLLLVLLRVFLYRPVLNVMQEREERLVKQWQEAEQARAEAAEQARQLAGEREQLGRTRLERLDQVEAEADRLLQRRVKEVEAEIKALRGRHQAALNDNLEQTVSRLRSRSAQLLVAELRASLRELADMELEQQTIRAFRSRLTALDQAQLNLLQDAARQQPAHISTAFDPGAEGRQLLTELLQEALHSEQQPEFSVDEELLFGIELTVGAQRVAVSGSERLRALTRAFNSALSELTHGNSPLGVNRAGR